MKYVVLMLALAMLVPVHGQLRNYDSSGKPEKPFDERVTIEFVNAPEPENLEAAGIVMTAVTTAVGIGVNAVKTYLTKRQESYTATYSSKKTGIGLMINNQKVALQDVIIKRETKADESSPFVAVSTIKLSLEQNGAVFRFKTSEIDVKKAKARIRKSKKSGQTIDLNIDLKLDAIWKDFKIEEVKPKADSTKKTETPVSGNTQRPKKEAPKVTFSLQNAALGESSITITGVKPGVKNNELFYSDWFQILPNVPDELPRSERINRGWYTLTVTVKEANPYGLTSKKISEFFGENSEGITNLITGFLPSGDDEKKDEEK